MTQDPDKLIESKVQVILVEFENLRESLLHATNHQRQVLLVSLGSAAVAIPALLSNTAVFALSAPVRAILLFTLSVVFGVMAANFASTMEEITAVGGYVDHKLRPKLNKILQTSGDDEL